MSNLFNWESDSRESNSIVLESIRFAVKKVVPREMILHMTLYEYAESLGNSLAYELSCLLYGKKEEAIEVILVPINWFEAVKERWLPSFLKKRFPIKYKTIKTIHTVYNICPHLDVPVNSCDRYVHFHFLQPSNAQKNTRAQR